jgi:D-alanine-D-alanine ligase
MKLIVLGGGVSSERDVSLRSAGAIATAARQAGYAVEERDPKDGLEFLKKIESGAIILPILHGVGGEDGSLQIKLEELKLAYLGSDSSASARAWDKWQALNIIRQAGLPIASSELVDRQSFKHHPLAQSPYVLKVRRGGSSLGVVIARDPASVDAKEIAAVFGMQEPAILEELIEGIEITIAVLDDRALPVVEIHPPEHGEFDYGNKYNGQSRELCPPESVDEPTQKLAQALALNAHQALGCRHLSRTDMMLRTDGQLFIMEVNTIPGLTDQSLFPKAAKAAGIPMPELVRRFVAMIQRDYGL